MGETCTHSRPRVGLNRLMGGDEVLLFFSPGPACDFRARHVDLHAYATGTASRNRGPCAIGWERGPSEDSGDFLLASARLVDLTISGWARFVAKYCSSSICLLGVFFARICISNPIKVTVVRYRCVLSAMVGSHAARISACWDYPSTSRATTQPRIPLCL